MSVFHCDTIIYYLWNWYYYRNAKQRIVSLFILESCEIIVLEEYHWIVYLLWLFGIILNDEKGYFGIQKWIFAKFTISKSVFTSLCYLHRKHFGSGWMAGKYSHFFLNSDTLCGNIWPLTLCATNRSRNESSIKFIHNQMPFSKRRQRIWTRFLYRFQTVDPRLKSNSLTSIF